jgi:hypothetical protein
VTLLDARGTPYAPALHFVAGILLGSYLSTAAADAHASPATAPVTADMLIQAGHEGRPDCNVEPARLCTGSRESRRP